LFAERRVILPQVKVKGVNIAYEERGTGKPVILLHGWNSSSKQWLHNLKALAPRFRAIAPDLPGFGDSEESELFPYTLDDMASFLEELRQALFLPSFCLVGHSMGGCISLRYSTLYGDNLDKLVLVSTPTRTSSMGLRARLPGVEGVLSMTYRLRSENVLKWMFYRGLYMPEEQDLDFVHANIKAASRISKHVLLETTRMVRRISLEEDLRSVGVPTLVVFGDRDRSVSTAEVERQRSMLPKSYIAVITASDHSPPYERPDMFNRLVLDFLVDDGLI
jgi:pimeloyl-ACP methyl ester carboxylesterase